MCFTCVLYRGMLGFLSLWFHVRCIAAACSPEPQRQTDVRRKIRDSWVDWNDHIQAWQRLSAEGQNVIAAIANIKLMAVYVNIQFASLQFSVLWDFCVMSV